MRLMVCVNLRAVCGKIHIEMKICEKKFHLHFFDYILATTSASTLSLSEYTNKDAQKRQIV